MAEHKAAQGWLKSHCLHWFIQPSVCTLVPPFLHDLSSYFPSAFFTHLWLSSWSSPLSSSPSLLLKACSWKLQADCYNSGVKQKSSLKMDMEFMKKVGKRIHCGCKMTFPFSKWMPKAITNKRSERKNNERTLFVCNSDLCWDGCKAVTTANNLQLKKGKMSTQAKATVLYLIYRNHQKRFQYLLHNIPVTRHPSKYNCGICSRVRNPRTGADFHSWMSI